MVSWLLWEIDLEAYHFDDVCLQGLRPNVYWHHMILCVEVFLDS